MEPLREGDPVSIRRYGKPAPKFGGCDNTAVAAAEFYTNESILIALP